ncbi:MAG: type 1 glutamine amidotransferase [Desulfosoma sp.]
MPRLHVLEHVPFEGPGHIAQWGAAQGFEIRTTRLHAGEPLPAPHAFDWLIVMGGPMNIYEDDLYPWLAEERRFINSAVISGKTILGICLGAQLLADALGSTVFRGMFKEIGWHPVEMTPEAAVSPLFKDFPSSFHAFHWHGDTFHIPEGAVHMARSAGCPSQAFVYEDRAIGLQFHLESTEETVEALLRHCGTEITEGPYIQDERTIRHLTPMFAPRAQELLEKLLMRLAEGKTA